MSEELDDTERDPADDAEFDAQDADDDAWERMQLRKFALEIIIRTPEVHWPKQASLIDSAQLVYDWLRSDDAE